jgi:hypothetical protein
MFGTEEEMPVSASKTTADRPPSPSLGTVMDLFTRTFWQNKPVIKYVKSASTDYQATQLIRN